MAIIPGQSCDRCAETQEQPVPAEHAWLGEFFCDNCMTSESEAAHERMLSDYYGGESPQSIHEQYDAAAKQKRSER